MSRIGWAGETEALSVAVDDGVTMVLEGNRLSLRVQGKPIWNRSFDGTFDQEKSRLDVHEMDSGTAIHVFLMSGDGARTEAVFALKAGRTRVIPVWEGQTQLKGDIGERTATAVRFEDLSGDGKPEIVVGEVSEGVTLCGKETKPLLFRRVFDFGSGKLRPVLARRVGFEPSQDIEGVFKVKSTTAEAGDAASAGFEPIVAASASRSSGDGGLVHLLSKPTRALDNNGDTAWLPWPGNGAGEFATFNTVSSAYGVVEVGVEPLIGQLKKRPYDRPKSLLMTTEKETFRLTFGQDAATLEDGVFWFALPKPVNTSCLSFIVESSWDARNTPVGLAEIAVKTEIDGPSGLKRLATDLGDDRLRRQAAMLLEKAGASAVPPILAIWKNLDSAGQRLALEVVAKADPQAGMRVLVEAALGEDTVARNAALEGLEKVPDSAVSALDAVLSSKDSEKSMGAIAVLETLGTEAALKTLATHAGKGEKARRQRIRGAIRGIALSSSDRAEALWKTIAATDIGGEWEKAVDLLRAAAPSEPLRERVVALVDRVFDEKPEFNDRYRLLAILGELDCELSRTRLLASVTDSDPQIRVVSVMGLGRFHPMTEEIQRAVQNALTDDATPVRLAALSVVATGGEGEGALPILTELTQKDPWPQVRAGAVAAVFGLSAGEALPVLAVAEKDASEMVRKAALEGAMRFKGPVADQIIGDRLQDPEESAALKVRAAVAVGRRCQKSALPILFSLLKVGAEPLAQQEAVEIAVAAARAMGQLGTPEAKAMLTEARKRSNPATDRAIDAALAVENGCSEK